jgi:metal-responsive CopG/Arc/MetJ family transcriptional regulator
MKTAISIPDKVFDQADEVAQRLGLSRSELYARAVEAFVKEYRRKGVTEALNRVYSKHPSGLDPVLAKMQFMSLPKEEW